MRDSVPGQDLEQPTESTGALFDSATLARYNSVITRLAKPYTLDARGRHVAAQYPPRVINSSVGLISTVRDLASYDSAIDRHLLVSADAQELAWTPFVTAAGVPPPHALGWFVQQYRGTRLIWHYGYWPQFSALYLKIPERELTLILLANSGELSSPFPLGAGDVRCPLLLVRFSKFSWIEGAEMRRGSLLTCVRAVSILAVALCVAGDAQPVFAQWLVVPFVGATAGAKTGYFDPDRAVEQKRPVLGVSVSKKWKRLYIEGDFAEIPGVFTGKDDDQVITSSNVLHLGGNLIATLPSLGPVTPYAVTGLGALHVRIRDEADVFPVSTWQPALTVGGGVLLRATSRIQIRADLRYAISRRDDGVASSIGFGTNYLDFWRPSVGVAFTF